MQEQPRLALNAAAWFFVGKTDETGPDKNMPIATPFRIGRRPDSDLYLPCSNVSGSHAEIREEDGQLWVYDLDSTNGTFVNGNRIKQKTRLRARDTIQFGTTVFHITQDSGTVDGTEDAEVPQKQRFERLLSGGVVPFFQPIVRIGTTSEESFGYEVLGRSKLYGLRTPEQMFAAASRLEMEAELSRVLRKQGIKIADNNLPPDQVLFVNTHPAEIECGGLKESLFEIRDQHPNRPVMLEVHESMLNNSSKILALRSMMKNLNIQLAFHDFGSSQVRMAELCETCPDVVKFDVKMTQGIDKASSKRQQFIASMVNMVKELGIMPMAECVEKSSEHETLKQLGFELGQGFHFGRPCSITDCLDVSLRSRINSEFDQVVPAIESFLRETAQDRSSTYDRPSVSSGPTATPRNEDWLMRQPGHFYTIQVLSAISEERALEHIAAQENPDEFAVFCKQGKTRMLYIVVYGIFEDRAAAKVASAKLESAAVSPWIRMLSSVHAEIRG